MLDEIEHYIDDGKLDEARLRISALSALGYAGDSLDQMTAVIDAGGGPQAAESEPAPDVAQAVEAPSEDRISIEIEEEAPAVVAAEPEPAPVVAAEVTCEPAVASADAPLDDDDLSAITSALESELFESDDDAPLLPEEDPEQSIDDIFAAFREQVKQEVGSDDYRTHYDLGIAYKEMGMVTEAIHEFDEATGCDGLRQDACNMIAICHRELGETQQAAEWYRKALETGGAQHAMSGLRYDLAEVLLQTGEIQAALEEFQVVMQQDPSFRDVGNRVSEIRTRLGC